MFTFVISLVVVGAALAIAARFVMGDSPQPATTGRRAGRAGGTHVVDDGVDVTWWRRGRALVLLTIILAVVGAVLALVVTAGFAVLYTELKNAVQ